MTSCNDFLNQEPLDQLSPNEYLTTESNIAAFATDQYGISLIFTDAIISLKMCFHRMKTMPLSETRPISNTISEKCISSELSCILKD